ncbi:MAG: hypothetical protein GSR80_001720 [Desulfurococcales archaeon]|nr:hypothetical protein [Desulfurococcales archaeon]
MSLADNECSLSIEVARRGLRKALNLLLEAADRTPPTIASRSLIEASMNFLLGALAALESPACRSHQEGSVRP